MFQIGSGELLVVGIVALFVLGPTRLLEIARFCGRVIARGKSVWLDLKNEIH